MTRILVDWGTSNARAFLVSESGSVLDRKQIDKGILRVAHGGFPTVLDDLTQGWRNREGDVPVLMSGMVGSRQGWAEAPYAACPVGVTDLAARLMPVPGQGNVLIVPGICLTEGAGRRDVIRGEEVQVLGALALADTAEAILCLPGTHSKWVRAEGGRITGFATTMTGEIYELVRIRSILARLMPAEDHQDVEAFRRGIERSATPGGLLHHLFSVRADALFDDLAPDALPSYLSGLLIGQEIRDMRAMHTVREGTDVILVAGDALAGLYGLAFHCIGVRFHLIDTTEATITGLQQVFAVAERRSATNRKTC